MWKKKLCPQCGEEMILIEAYIVLYMNSGMQYEYERFECETCELVFKDTTETKIKIKKRG